MKAAVNYLMKAPHCERCNKTVEAFFITQEADGVKFEVECHGAYEMVRILDRDQVIGLSFLPAFRSA